MVRVVGGVVICFRSIRCVVLRLLVSLCVVVSFIVLCLRVVCCVCCVAFTLSYVCDLG